MIESAAAWRKSSRSNLNSCVEVRRHRHAVEVRQSKDPEGPVLSFSPMEWQAFVEGVRAGEFDHLS